MQNGQDHSPAAAPSAAAAPGSRAINPQQAAAFGLEFLERASHTRAERERFDMAQALLTAIMQGQVSIAAAQPQPPQAANDPGAGEGKPA